MNDWVVSCWDGDQTWHIGPLSEEAAYRAALAVRASGPVAAIPFRLEPWNPDDYRQPAVSAWARSAA